MQTASSLQTRLALALLAVAGFVAPSPSREADVQVQRLVVEQASAPAAVAKREFFLPLASDAAHAPLARLPDGRSQHRAPKYLLHRSWLI